MANSSHDLDEAAVWYALSTSLMDGAVERIERLFAYLQLFPTGAHNRKAASQIEELLESVSRIEHRTELRRRYRALRDPYLPPVRPNTWNPRE